MLPNLFLDEIKDEFTRENFRLLLNFLSEQRLLQGEFKHFEVTVSSAVTGRLFTHGLGFAPKDLIPTFISDSATVSWDYDAFNQTTIKFTTNKATTIRFLLGRYRKEFFR